MSVAPRRQSRGVAAIVAGLLAWAAVLRAPARAQAPALTDPLIGNRHAIAEGKDLYRRHCFICHLHAGGRGPDLFTGTLTDRQFAETVINGRGLMPAWGERLSLDAIWKIRAYVKSTDRYDD